MRRRIFSQKKRLALASLFVATVIGLGTGYTFNVRPAQAQENTTNKTQSTPPVDQPDAQGDQSKGGHVGQNGTREEILSGDTAEKVKEAALAAVPGGTIERVETDAEGSPYEAHMTKADGTRVTVKVDSNFKVTTTEDGRH